jgi:hypothetical protein
MTGGVVTIEAAKVGAVTIEAVTIEAVTIEALKASWVKGGGKRPDEPSKT